MENLITSNLENKYYIETFGCQMNVHESEKVAGILVSLGYEETKERAQAKIIVFNTCCIRDTAEKKIFGNIGELKILKRLDKSRIIVIFGCMTQQEGMAELVASKFPFVDIILGTSNVHLLADKIKELEERRARKRGKVIDIDTNERPAVIEDVVPYRTSYPNAWVNIMYGCNNFCSYCIVPYVRGRERSRNPELILEEINALLKAGYKEITLLGQNVDSYGSDRNDGVNFYTLLNKIAQIDTKFRLRFMTSHPKDLSEEVIKLIAETPNFCNNIHLPVQAGSNAVLKAMNRRYDRDRYFYLIDLIKKYMPDCGVTSDIMVGFPGETEEDFLDTLDLVKKVRYHNAFTFIYSPRKGTVAAKMEQIPYAIKSERIKRLIALQNQITLEISETYVGKIKEVLVEDAPKEGYLCGRTDCGRLVNFKGNKEMVGQFVNVKIEKNKASALIGEIVNEC
ncbi:MAG: tRNA (N6-isopentenyl adenosine(37)-C2)-methylthiotransferase MiaB [Clostridia bacterium]|nr:tRNA (N6-isopentenyl adenosine(37)-C2)-methylthiotransferase MiaB [Clostridia bacterium]